MIKFLNYFIQSLIIYFFFLIGWLIRIKLSRILFSYIFFIVGPLFKSKKVVLKNLEVFSSTVKNINKKAIINQMWKNYGMTFIEYIYLDKLRKSKSHVTVLGKENLTKMNIKLATIYRPLNNIFLNPFMEFLRKKYICKNQIKKGINGVRDTINYLKKNYSIALMIDQRVSEGEKISFFGKKALTTTLPAQLSLKLNIDIVPVYIERTKNNNFIIEFKRPVSHKKFKNKTELSEELNRILEKMIIKNPYQWIWTHNRWK